MIEDTTQPSHIGLNRAFEPWYNLILDGAKSENIIANKAIGVFKMLNEKHARVYKFKLPPFLSSNESVTTYGLLMKHLSR